MLGLTVGLSAISIAKMSYLTEPLYPSDYQFLRSTEFLFEMVKPATSWPRRWGRCCSSLAP